MEPYEKPFLNKLTTGTMNKFGTGNLHPVREEIGGVPINRLVEQHGSPLFVFSEERLRRDCRSFQSAFTTRYPNVAFSWSYKTNYLDAVCAILLQEGEEAEVVSEFEYEKARRLGVPGDKIIFNGPYKPMPALEKAVKEGAMINIDHLEELCDLEEIARKMNKKIKVGIRLNMDTGITPQWTRFGFNLESGQAYDAVKRIKSGGRLVLNGLHCHQGTYIMVPSAYRIQAEKMISFASMVEENFGYGIEYFDMGGGFPSHARLKGAYLSPEISVPPLEEYAEAIMDTFLRLLKPDDFPKVILEAGRAVVDASGFLIATVHAVKRLPDGKKSYILDAGLNTLFTSFWYKHKIEIDGRIEGPFEDCVVHGPLCMNIDVIDEQAFLPPLSRGSRLILSPVGAYNNTQWMQFICYRPAVVLVGEAGGVEIIRQAETMDDIVARERLPDRLGLNQGKAE